MASDDDVEVLLFQTVTEDSKVESEEYYGAEYIHEIEMFRADHLQFPHTV